MEKEKALLLSEEEEVWGKKRESLTIKLLISMDEVWM